MSNATGTLFDLTGKSVLLTGCGAGGLGFHSAVALAEHGADIFLSDAPGRETDIEKTAAAVAATGRDAATALCDVTSEEDVDELVRSAMRRFGKIDILVHHAGVMLRKDTFEMSLAEWKRVIDVNMTGTWLMDRRVAQEMVQRGAGKIINMGTVYTNIVGPVPESAYYASKAGIANMTRGFAVEWGRQGVSVNCMAPGVFYPTNMTQPLRDAPERLAWFANRTACGRVGDPEHDLKGVVVFLASAAADYITGQVLFVDGGWSAW